MPNKKPPDWNPLLPFWSYSCTDMGAGYRLEDNSGGVLTSPVTVTCDATGAWTQTGNAPFKCASKMDGPDRTAPDASPLLLYVHRIYVPYRRAHRPNNWEPPPTNQPTRRSGWHRHRYLHVHLGHVPPQYWGDHLHCHVPGWLHVGLRHGHRGVPDSLHDWPADTTHRDWHRIVHKSSYQSRSLGGYRDRVRKHDRLHWPVDTCDYIKTFTLGTAPKVWKVCFRKSIKSASTFFTEFLCRSTSLQTLRRFT